MLNPIESIWSMVKASVKRFISQNERNFKFSTKGFISERQSPPSFETWPIYAFICNSNKFKELYPMLLNIILRLFKNNIWNIKKLIF